MIAERLDQRKINERGSYAGGLKPAPIGERPRSQRRYRDVAFVASGKGKHRAAAQERAVWLTEKSPINLTPLNGATDNVWRGRYDLVIAGSEDPWERRDVMLGNTESNLVRHSRSDVLIVRHRPVPPSGRIVVAIAPDPIDDRQTRLASETIKAAITFADWEDSELHVVNVVPSAAYYTLALNAGFSVDEAKGLEAEARLNQQNTVYRFLDTVGSDRDRMQVHLLQGNPVQKIANLVSHLDADLLAIGSVRRRGLGRLLIGNTAEKVMRQIACSCLVVKPERSSEELTD
jgi:nucleotide-binding universal stress UspA family protein